MLLALSGSKVERMDLVDWMLVHDRWLHSRLGKPDGPPPELVAAWSRTQWLEVSRLCDVWTREVEAGPLSRTQTQDDRERVIHDLLVPIRLVKTVAGTLNGGAAYAGVIRRGRAQGGLDRLEILLDSVFKSYVEHGTSGWMEQVLVTRVEQLVAVFVDAHDHGVDLSVSRAEIEIGDC
jgi:hypothetical protein